MEMLEIWDRHDIVGKFSKGMKQKIAIARRWSTTLSFCSWTSLHPVWTPRPPSPFATSSWS